VPNFADAFESDTRESKSIAIGDYVWIGTNAFICAGVSVGNNSIIGANSVVTKDVPADSVVGGVPARLIHYKSAYISKNRGLGLP
jgi:maltose O-acetyltransferase